MFCFLFLLQLISKVIFNKNNPEESLRLLVEDLDNNPISMKSIPKDFVDYFSIPGLVNSLNIQLAEPPKYNGALVEKAMKKKSFKNPDALAKYIIKTFKYPIDRLYAIFYYEGHNIIYDDESFLTNSIKYKTLEEIFESKLGVCGHFALFMEEMAKKCQIKEIEIQQYINYAKGVLYDPLNPPKVSNHAAILIKYNNSLFISEPTWGRNSVLSKFHPAYFLNPIEKMLNSHFPDKPKLDLPFAFTYEQFNKLLHIKMSDKDLKVESHPFWFYDCYDGYMSFQFSCSKNVSDINYNLKLVNGTEIYFDNVNIETLTGERKRFILHVIFPKEGLFELSLWLDHRFMLTYQIKNHAYNKNSPVLSSHENDYKFALIEPKTFVTDVDSNYYILKFVSSKDSYHTLIEKSGDQWYYTRYNVKRLAVPNNDNLTEKWIMINFNGQGLYIKKLWISYNEDFSDTPLEILLIFNVSTSSTTRRPNIEKFIPKEKEELYPDDLNYIDSTPYLESFVNISKLVFRKGKDILTNIDYEKGQKKIMEIMNSLKNYSQNAYNDFDAEEAKRKVTELSNKLLLISKEMYDNFDSEAVKDSLKENTNKLVLQIKDLSNNFDSEDIKQKVIQISDSVASYGKQIINNFDFEKTKTTIIEKSKQAISKVKQAYNDFDYQETKEYVKDKTNQIINKGKQMYNDFNYQETKENVKNSIKDKYNRAKNFFKKDDDDL